MYYLLYFFSGLIVGSFLNTVIYRLPFTLGLDPKDDEKIIKFFEPRSHCPNCYSQIPLYQNIPLLSILLLKGKCPICHHKISSRYWIVELLTGLGFLYILLLNETVFDKSLLIALVCLLISLSFIDLRYQILPNSLNYLLILSGILFNLKQTDTIIASLIGMTIGYLFFLIIEKGYFKIYGKQGIGRGDAKMLSGIGAWIGWSSLPIVLLSSSLLAICAYTLLKTSLIFENKEGIAFGPFMSVSALLVVFFNSGKNII
jgi:leader peptidase (prepilin peptidase)/N-methyltransferase|tara:strand:- start:91 stop:864 length:774 start_codon:yes stop_codon:yes gene_type:complete